MMGGAYPYRWRWSKWLGDRYGQACQVLVRARGKGPRNILVLFTDGHQVVAPMWAVRREGTDGV